MRRFLVAAYLSLSSITALYADQIATYDRTRAYDTTIHKVITEPKPRMDVVSAWTDGRGRSTLTDLVERYEINKRTSVIAAVNASFYGRQGTVGATMINGRLIQKRPYHRAQVGYAKGDLIFGYNLENSHKGLEWLITAGPYLVRGGKIIAPQSFWHEQWSSSTYLRRHPRSAIGRRSDGSVILVVTQGRGSSEQGLTLTETAKLMHAYGCVEAINLDGGGSAELIYDHHVKNRPTDGHERSIPNAILVVH